MAKKKFTLTSEQIAAAVGASVEDVQANWPAVEKALDARGMTDAATKIAAIATIGTEVGTTFRPINEYGGAAYFTRMYEGDSDLGNTRKGDGARYHGRGYIQLTGRANYRTYGKQLGLPLEEKPDLALTPEVAASVLADYFKARRIDASAAKGDWESVRRKVNGGLNGWPTFRDLVRKLEQAVAQKPDGAPAERPKRGRLRTLRLTSPFMSGPDVAEARRALGVPVGGEYDPVTASAVAEWKRRIGYPEGRIDNVLGPAGFRLLLGMSKLPADFERRKEARARRLASAGTVPERAVAEMEEWASAGLREKPAGSNKVPELVRLAGELDVAGRIQGMGFPWCAFSAFLAALKAGGKTAELGLRKERFNALYCPTILHEAQAGKWGLRVVAPSQAARGDLVLFDWSPQGDPADHVGRLRRPPAEGMVATVDGNSGEDDLFVATRERSMSTVRAFVRDS